MDNVLKMKPSDLDEYQMNNRSFDDKKDAWRVSVVDGVTLNVDQINLPELKLPEQQVIQVPVIVKETEVHQINVPVIIKEIQIERIEVPIIIKETQTVYVDRPVMIPEIRVVEIEKPIIVFKNLEMPMLAKVCMVVQAIAVVGLLLTHIILKG